MGVRVETNTQILKATVLGELEWLASIRGDIAVRRLREVYAYCDALPDEWWRKRANLPMADWLHAMAQAYGERG